MTLLVSIALLLAGATHHARIRQIDYTLRIDSTDMSVFRIDMRVHNAPATFTVAAAAHPEYDDKYWRYVEGMRVDGGSVTRVDSSLWRISARPGDVVIHYKVRPPASPAGLRAAWPAFLSATGALGGGPHTFLYVLGAERASARVTVEAPRGWQVATGLQSAGAREFVAPDIATLEDSPILMGQLSEWRFQIDGVPHRVVYLRTAQTVPFDSAAMVAGIERFARATVTLFGGMPYREYVFMYEDGAYSGGLEHINSVTMGALSTDLARNPNAVLPETAHEFFHTWNLMAMRPAEYRGVDYRTQPPVASLWFSEGLTIFYADLLRRRAHLPVSDATRTARLEYLLGSYLGNAGNSRFSAEQVSRVAYNSQPDALGDYSVSTHLQGEVLGNVLDIVVRAATDGARSMDDVMRLLYGRFAGRPGFTGHDIERAVNDVCGCSVAEIFDSYVRGAGSIDFNRYLALLGLRPTITWTDARNANGELLPDMRVRGWQGEDGVRLIVWAPQSSWVRAGLHTGDRLVSINGARITTLPEMRNVLGALHVGDTARIEVTRPGGPYAVTVKIGGWQRPLVSITEVANATEKQRRLREQWLNAR